MSRHRLRYNRKILLIPFFLRRAGHNLWFSIWKTQLIFPQKQATNLEGLPKPSDPIQLNHFDYIVEGNRWTSVRRGLLFFIVRMTKFSKGLWRYEMLSGKVQRTFVCRSEVTLNSLNHHSSFFLVLLLHQRCRRHLKMVAVPWAHVEFVLC